MKALTPSVYTFENLLKDNFLYIDKTEYLWKLVQPAQGFYFLSRPRRFGKSLTLSTLKAIFQGKRELFKGLAIDGKDYEWKSYPVIHLNFANCDARNAQELEDYLHDQVNIIARTNQVQLNEKRLASRFQTLISSMDNGIGVVVLVDEYDKPLLNNLGNAQATREMLPIMKGFYSVIKQCDEHERFVFVTGVTKFCHVSLFSDLNNLQDISLNADYATMLGYTQQELESNFKDWIADAEARQPQSVTHDEFLAQIRAWYDGYRFEETAENVYNPVSLANFFMKHGKFGNYWFTTGTTSSLFQLMRQSNKGLPDILEGTVSGELFDSFDLDAVDIRKLMYQTGYLTIGDTETVMPGTENEELLYRLRFPNKEVRRSFSNQVMEHYAGMQTADTLEIVSTLVRCLQENNVDGFMEQLKRVFAQIPYNLHQHQEHDFQTVLYVLFLMLKVSVKGEYHTNEGRIDLVLTTEKYSYVIELKVNKTARKALAQIWDRDYARGFLGQGKRVVAVGVNFNGKKAQIDNWMVAEII